MIVIGSVTSILLAATVLCIALYIRMQPEPSARAFSQCKTFT